MCIRQEFADACHWAALPPRFNGLRLLPQRKTSDPNRSTRSNPSWIERVSTLLKQRVRGHCRKRKPDAWQQIGLSDVEVGR